MKKNFVFYFILLLSQLGACRDGGNESASNQANELIPSNPVQEAPIAASEEIASAKSFDSDLTFAPVYDTVYMAHITYEREECPVALELRAFADPDTSDGYFKPAVFVHGGGWLGRPNWEDTEELVEPVRYLLDRGYIVYYITYRLPVDMQAANLKIAENPVAYSCEQHWVEMNKDVSFAINGIANRDPMFPGTNMLDPDAKIFLTGASAGAQLAVYFAAHEPLHILSVYPIVGIYDFDAMWENATFNNEWADTYLNTITLIDAYLDGYFLEEPIGSDFLFENTLSNHYSSEWPKIYLVSGLADTIIPYESVDEFCRKVAEASGEPIVTIVDNDDLQVKSCAPNVMLETHKKAGHFNTKIAPEELAGARGLSLLSGEFPMPQTTGT